MILFIHNRKINKAIIGVFMKKILISTTIFVIYGVSVLSGGDMERVVERTREERRGHAEDLFDTGIEYFGKMHSAFLEEQRMKASGRSGVGESGIVRYAENALSLLNNKIFDDYPDLKLEAQELRAQILRLDFKEGWREEARTILDALTKQNLNQLVKLNALLYLGEMYMEDKVYEKAAPLFREIRNMLGAQKRAFEDEGEEDKLEELKKIEEDLCAHQIALERALESVRREKLKEEKDVQFDPRMDKTGS